jgi:hypothetical protein
MQTSTQPPCSRQRFDWKLMPRFFFHVCRDEDVFDEEGMLLPDAEAAKTLLVISSAEFLGDLAGHFWQGSPVRAWVTSETGETVAALVVHSGKWSDPNFD